VKPLGNIKKCFRAPEERSHLDQNEKRLRRITPLLPEEGWQRLPLTGWRECGLALLLPEEEWHRFGDEVVGAPDREAALALSFTRQKLLPHTSSAS